MASKRQSQVGESVGIAELRANLAKYLKQASAGRPIIVRERGRPTWILTRYQERQEDVFGCMKERTRYEQGTVLNADESWLPGKMP